MKVIIVSNVYLSIFEVYSLNFCILEFCNLRLRNLSSLRHNLFHEPPLQRRFPDFCQLLHASSSPLSLHNESIFYSVSLIFHFSVILIIHCVFVIFNSSHSCV